MLRGYIGTVAQLEFILPKNYSANKTLIYSFLTKLSYTPNYSSKDLLSSLQTNYGTCNYWRSVGSWSTQPKHYSGLVLPLFSF